jgi:hypothetical protein
MISDGARSPPSPVAAPAPHCCFPSIRDSPPPGSRALATVIHRSQNPVSGSRLMAWSVSTNRRRGEGTGLERRRAAGGRPDKPLQGVTPAAGFGAGRIFPQWAGPDNGAAVRLVKAIEGLNRRQTAPGRQIHPASAAKADSPRSRCAQVQIPVPFPTPCSACESRC